MLRRNLVKAIYAELRAGSAGTEVSAIDLLKLAQHIVKAYTDPDSVIETEATEREWRGFVHSPVDVAMSDGGWKVLAFEQKAFSSYGDASIEDITLLRSKVEKFFGPEWRHPILMGQL